MKCRSCESEWDVLASAQMLQCPFCDILIYEIPEHVLDLESALKFLVGLYGKDLLLNKRITLKNLTVCIPDHLSDLNLFKIAHENGIVKDIIKLDAENPTEARISQRMKRAIYNLESNFGLDHEWAKHVVRALMYAVGIPMSDDEVLFASLQKKAKTGDVESQYELAMKYRVKDDDENYIKWLSSAASLGHAPAQCDLGLCYLRGRGVSKDNEQALLWLSKSARQQYSSAQYALGKYGIEGEFPSILVNEAVNLLEAAGNSGISDAFLELGIMFEEGILVEGNDEMVKLYYEEASLQGNVNAKIRYGLWMLRHDSTKPHSFLGLQSLKDAAGDGSVKAMRTLGLVFEEGIGVPSNYNSAIFWYKSAAESGDAEAQYKMGQLYEEGLSVAKDVEEAIDWYIVASQNGHDIAKQKIDYKSPACILRFVYLSLEDGTEVKYPFKGMVEYNNIVYMIITDPENGKLYPYVYTQLKDNFEVTRVESNRERRAVLNHFKQNYGGLHG